MKNTIFILLAFICLNTAAQNPAPSKIVFTNLAQLAQQVGIPGSKVTVAGASTITDGGGGEFVWDALSVETPVAGIIVQVTGVATGRWKRLYGATYTQNQYAAKQTANAWFDTSKVLKLRADSIRNISGHLDIRTGSNNLNLTGYDINLVGSNAVIFNGSVRNDGTSGYSAKHATGTNYTSIVFAGGAASYTASFPAKTGTVAFLDDITGGDGYTDEQAQDAIGAMVSSEFTYTDATPLLAINTIAQGKITNLTSDLAAKLSTSSAASTYVPYTDATGTVDIGSQNLLTTGNVQGISKSPNADLFDFYDFDDNNIVRFSNGTAFRAGFDFSSLTANSAIAFPNVAAGIVVYNDNTATLTNKSIAATQLTGTINDARLSNNVSLLDAVQTITGLKSFSLTAANSSAIAPGLIVAPVINQSGTAGYYGLVVSPYEQATGSGNKFLLNLGTNSAANYGGTHTPKMYVDNAGNTTIAGTLNVALNTGLAGTVTLTGLSNTGSAPTNILNMSSGVMGFRTLAQTLTDLGAVPYTGATANLVMGSFALQGLHVSNDASDFDLRGSASNVLMKVQNTAGFQPTLNFNSLTVGRIFTFPNVAGTIVLEAATQTLTNKSIDATQLTGTVADARLSTKVGFAMSNTYGATTVTASTTQYGVLGGGAQTFATEAQRLNVVPVTGLIRSLYLVTSGTQPSSGALVITLRKNQANTSMTITIPLSSSTAAWNDLVNTVSVTAGDVIALQFANAATAASLNIVGAGVFITPQ